MSATNSGKYVSSEKIDGDDTNEVGYRVSRENDKIDAKYGFERVKDTVERTGYLINMHSTEILDENRRLVSALDLFFIQMDGTRFKASVVYQPYFLILPRKDQSLELARFLGKKYAGQLARIEHVMKEDLDLANHLSGLKQDYLQLWFSNNNNLIKVRREIMSAVKKNRERNKSNTYYIKMLSNTLASSSDNSNKIQKNFDCMELIEDIREYDVPYHVRVSIDLKIFCGLWYNIRCRSSQEIPQITKRPDILERPEPIILAFDIETTKLPLKFPDAQTDQIMMISYMIDGQGYLITNREIISIDVNDFEYTPKPEFEGNFIIFNEANEMLLLQKFFNHIMDIKPHILVTYNGDFFDWPFVETRAAFYDMDMKQEIGYSKSRDGTYLCRPSIHMDCLCWVKRDSYLPVGSQGLKAVAKAKLRYDPVELDPEEMCKMAIEQPQVLSNYSVSDAVATYYLYMKYVHTFIFALSTIIPMEPDEILRKGSGTLCETLLMVEAYHANIIFPNKQLTELNKLSKDGHVLDSETYVGGHVEALESGVFRADIPCRFRLDQHQITELINNVEKVIQHTIEVEENIPLAMITNLDDVIKEIKDRLNQLFNTPNRLEQPVIYHLDVGAMYPNIILTNRLQPSAIVTETDCSSCDFNKPDALCKRNMDWLWRGEMLPASRNEFHRIQQQLETEKFPPLFPGGKQRAFHELSKEDQANYEKKRLTDYCRTAYKKVKITKLETKTSTVCQKENSFYVDTVRAFRDRRYEYKGLTKTAKNDVSKAAATSDVNEIKLAKGREVLYDSLQLAHKCILNSFYGYVMRRGARWHSMSMAGIVCLTGSNIIRRAREIIEKIGRPLELDTDGIWCMLPGTFPQEFTILTSHEKKKKFNISYPNAVLNTMVKELFTNDQYHELIKPPSEKEDPEYELRNENSIFFEVDGPYLAMVLPAAKEEGKKLKKRYAVFNFNGTLAELKGFEVKRRGELQLIKIFQSSVFEAFLQGTTLEECYSCVAKIADYWLDVLYSKGCNMPDSELFELISENRSMSKKLEDYGKQKSLSISTAKRLAEFLGDQMVKDAGLSCKYIISKKPEGSPVTERAIPLAIFQSELSIKRHYLRRWLKDNTINDIDIRDVLDWNYYIERLGGTIQKIITIPAALQGLNNPVPRVTHPEWLHKKMLEKTDVLKQRRINEMFCIEDKQMALERQKEREQDINRDIIDIEDLVLISNDDRRPKNVSIATKRKRTNSASTMENNEILNKTWREILGPLPNKEDDFQKWIMYHKKKWTIQLKKKKLLKTNYKRSKTTTNENSNIVVESRTNSSTLGGFLKNQQRSMLSMPWHIIQIVKIDDLGHFYVWALIDKNLHKIKLTVPRIFYVNQRTELTKRPEDAKDVVWQKVTRVLPRSRPLYYLYEYIIPEQLFKDKQLGMLADLATPDIEGIYETQMSLDLRAIIRLGCVCCVSVHERKRLIKENQKNEESFNLQQLEMTKNYDLDNYLHKNEVLKKIFLYQHSIPSGKREIWSLFIPVIKKSLVIVLDTVRNNQMPNIKNLYLSERRAIINLNPSIVESIPVEDINFDVIMEIEVKHVYSQIQRALQSYKSEKKGPTILCIQSLMNLNTLNVLMPILKDFPQMQIHITDEASMLSGLDWQRNGIKTIIRHYLNHTSIYELMLNECKTTNIPIGNMPIDNIIFSIDVYYSRLLYKYNFILWSSITKRPDLGGREYDDNRLLLDNDDTNTNIIINNNGFYNNICIELIIDSLAVSALLQMKKINEIEGASSAITFDVIPQASLDDMINQNEHILPSYDETALCSQALRLMRTMINQWIHNITISRNIYSDTQIIHFYRWIKSSNSLLYDPALRRSLNIIIKKYFLQLLNELKVHGADIIYADYNRIIINTKKSTILDGINYVDYIVKNIRNKELFHSINLSYQECWNFLLWLDSSNYAGIKGKLPKELRENDSDDEDIMTEEDSQNEVLKLEMNWNIIENYATIDNFHEYFNEIIKYLIELLINDTDSSIITSTLSNHLYEMIEKLNKNYERGCKTSPALTFINILYVVLKINKDLTDDVNLLRRNMLKLIGIGEFSDVAVYQDTVKSFILNDVICKACNYCRNLDLLKDKFKALNNGVPVWLCSQCLIYYENSDIELMILDTMQKKIMSYTLQDLLCVRCNNIKNDNMLMICKCAGNFKTLISKDDLLKYFRTFEVISKQHQMEMLQEYVALIINAEN